MKRLIYSLLILTPILAISCMKDMTNMDTTTINPVVIDTTGLTARGGLYEVFQADSFKVKPKASKEGLSATDLKYEWTINAYGGYKRVVGSEMQLATKITEAPGNYALIYTVTDPKTNLKGFFSWPLIVNSAFGSGLLVADTKDGVSSDLNLIMAPNFTPSIFDAENQRIFRGLYSEANSKKIEGVVKGVSYMNYNGSRILAAITDNAIIRVNPLNYKFTENDAQCFILPPSQISPTKVQSIQKINQHEYIVNNGKVHSRFGSSGAFGYHLLGDNLDYFTNNICGLQSGFDPGGMIYDEKNNRFMLLPRIVSNNLPVTAFPPVDNSGVPPAFDPRNIGNKTCLHLEEGQSSRVLAVMKDRDAANYFVYQVLMSPKNGKMGHSLYDISNNPEINLSKYYTCSSSENVLFYATDNHVYATAFLPGGATAANLRYTVASGEKITGMQMHRMQGFMNLPSLVDPTNFEWRQEVPSANRLLILSTYNEATKNGKIITIPIQTLGVGGLVTDPAYINTYSGFGKITAFGNQNQ